MKLIKYHRASTIDLLETATALFKKNRDSGNNDFSEKEIMGINYTIILNSACILEGKLEMILLSIIYYFQSSFMNFNIDKKYNYYLSDIFLDNLITDLKNRISRMTGSNNYLSFIESHITNYQKSQKMKDMSEGINVLFEFRNVLAHGRMITAKTEKTISYPESIESDNVDFFKGGYKNTEDYLIKNKLITTTFLGDKKDRSYFENNVADHFFELSQNYFNEFMLTLPKEIRDFVTNDLQIKD